MRKRIPLNRGDRIPEDIFRQDFAGHPILLAFSSQDWDPYRQETLALYADLLVQVFGADARLLTLQRQGSWCDMELKAGHIHFPLLINAAEQGSLVEAFGVEDSEALFVIDSEGMICWRYLNQRGVPPSPQFLASSLAELKQELNPTRDCAMELSRRHFVLTGLALASLAAMGLSDPVLAAPPATKSASMPIQLRVNGTLVDVKVEPRVTLLDALRDHLNLTGSKKGCDHGQCGACTVLVDGRRINSCLSFAIMNQGKNITTIEGLAQGNELHPLQKAFIVRDGFQCGYCTPGQIMSAQGLINEGCGPQDGDVREAMSGNICRCGCYTNIVAAIQDVRRGGNKHASV